ncbi:MAG: sensor histidine kinase [Stenomitos frigidus ULC029]
MPSSLNNPSFSSKQSDTTGFDAIDDCLMQARFEQQALKEQIAQQTQLMHLLTHQLATPLTALGGSLPLLAEASLEAAHRQEFLDVVQQQVYRLKSLLHDLMALRNLETGVLETHAMSLCLPDMVEAVMSNFHTNQIVPQFSPDLPFIWGDRWQLSQVLVNLLSNALKYSPANSPIEVGAAVCGTSLVEVWVRDRGLGIPAADQPHLFERFYRVQHRDRADIKGTGLGLSLCQLLVENQGGQLRFESTHGEGSCFFFTLPTVNCLPQVEQS